MVAVSHPCLALTPWCHSKPKHVLVTCAADAFLEQAHAFRLGHSAPVPGWQEQIMGKVGKRARSHPWDRSAPQALQVLPCREAANKGTKSCWQGSEGKSAC